MKKSLVLPFIVILGVAALLYFWVITNPPECLSGNGDCVVYTGMTKSFQTQSFGDLVDAPFNKRILAPYIGSLMPWSITANFQILNALCFVIFLILWNGIARHLKFDSADIIFGAAWFIFHPLGMGLYAVIPVHVDPLWYLFSTAAFYAWLKKQYCVLAAIFILGGLAKESFGIILLTMALADLGSVVIKFLGRKNQTQRWSKDLWPMLASYIVAGGAAAVAKNMIDKFLFPQAQPYPITGLSTIQWFLNQALMDPWLILVWLSAALVSTGFVSIFMWRAIASKPLWPKWAEALKTRELLFLVLSGLGYVALGFLAGSDMSRIIFNGSLFTLTLFTLLAHLFGYDLRLKIGVYAASLALLWIYPKFFSTSIEYSYYDAKDVAPFLWFLLIGIIILIFFGGARLEKIIRNKA